MIYWKIFSVYAIILPAHFEFSNIKYSSIVSKFLFHMHGARYKLEMLDWSGKLECLRGICISLYLENAIKRSF